MAVSSRLRVALIALPAAVAIACAAAAMTLSGAAAAPRSGPDQTQLILRLHDLPPGYLKVELQEEQGERIYCAPLTHPDDTPPKLARFVIRFHPKGCIGAYSRLFTPPGQSPGPEIAGTGVLAMTSRRAADAAWAIVPELLGRLLNDRVPREVPPTATVGRSTRLFHSDDLPRIFAAAGNRASFLVWRSGDTLATVEVIGSSFAEDDRIAAELAPRQQAHIRAPTPYTRAERFDGEVGLDDPAIDVPVYWLGRNFRPGKGLPPNKLFESGFRGQPRPESTDGIFDEGPGAPLEVNYDNIWLGTWTPATWSVFANSKTGRAVTSWKCTQTRTVELAGGSATIFGGYAENLAQCPKRPPEAFTAWVDVGGVTVVVDAPFAADSIETGNPYGSFKGMEAIVRGLVLRPKPTY